MWNWKNIKESELNGIINCFWNKNIQNLFDKIKFKDLNEILEETNEFCGGEEEKGKELINNNENKQKNLKFLEIIKEYKNCDEFDYFSKCVNFINFV